jgi:alpha-beta hydrolase superfamily lysophospholipase
MRPIFRKASLALTYVSLGAVLGLIIAFVIYLDSRSNLQLWHIVELDAEFTAESNVADFEAYLALEDRLFRQLDQAIYDVLPAARDQSIDRYRRGSLSDPQRWSPDWNRSFVLPTESPNAAVLLLHGMSDSPYSLRQLGERLHAAGAYVIGLRLPGHGTAPSGLVELTWQDMDAALRLAVEHLAEQVTGRPLYLVGYSTGAALAVNYALATLDEAALPKIERIAVLSPAIGVTPAAAYAVWQARLGHILGLEKLAWSDILPEYDPFKYNSFAVNAGDVVYRLTREIQQRIAERTKQEGGLTGLPSILAFSSVVDATVSTPALIEGLFKHLPAGDHELVLFDINRRAEIETILGWNPATIIGALQKDTSRSYRLSLVTNENPSSDQVVVRTVGVANDEIDTKPLHLPWPVGLYSLSHVALPFPPVDPLYGGAPNTPSPGIRLGTLALRGERSVLQVGAADMLRLRWNPFFPFVQKRTLQFFALDGR